MKRPMYDPKARVKQLREQRKKAAAEAKMLEEANLRMRNMEILMGIEEGDRPFWPGCSVHLRVGAIRPMRTIDSIVNKAGLQGDLVASGSSFVLDIPNYADVEVSLERCAHVEFVVGSWNRVVGLRGGPAGRWSFIVTLTAEEMGRLRSFVAATDPSEVAWFSPEATVVIRSEVLAPLPSEGHETLNFVGLVSSLQLGSPVPVES